MERISIIDLVEQIPTEADAYAFMERLRWPDKPICPHCASEAEHRFLAPENGSSRRTRTGTLSQRRVWKCRDCKRQFSVITNTPFHGSKVPLRTWLFVLFEMCANKNGIAAREIARKYRLTNKTAWFVTHRVRLAMETLPVAKPMSGTIVADESWVGGDPVRMNAKTRRRLDGVGEEPVRVTPSNRPHQHTAKTSVLSLIETRSGEVRSKVVADVSGPTLRKAMAGQVDMNHSHLMTDEGSWYNQLGREFLSHATVNHSAGEYVRGSVTSNQAENYFSQLKRSLDGTHHHISKEHLPRYLAEFDFRYSTRRLTDTQRMARLMGQTAGRRLSYKRVKSS
jgi:transposase-like protein